MLIVVPNIYDLIYNKTHYFECVQGGSLVKPRSGCVKFTFFVKVPLVKYHVIGFASTRGHEKQPAVIDFEVAQSRGKTADLTTLSGGDVLPVKVWSSTRPLSAARPISVSLSGNWTHCWSVRRNIYIRRPKIQCIPSKMDKTILWGT